MCGHLHSSVSMLTWTVTEQQMGADVGQLLCMGDHDMQDSAYISDHTAPKCSLM